MPKYAAGTDVSIGKSQTEIQQLLSRYGATNYVMGAVNGQIAVMFEAHARRIRLSVPMPVLTDADRLVSVNGSSRRQRSDAEQAKFLDQKERQHWRILALIIKAKLEIIETGAVSFRDEFLPYTMLADGATVGEWIAPQMDEVAISGQMPPMLPGSSRANVIALGERSTP